MDRHPPSDQVLDQTFFRATGLVMVLVTLMSGAITLSLAFNMAGAQSNQVTPYTAEIEPAVLNVFGKTGVQVSDGERTVMLKAIGITNSQLGN